MKINEVIKNEQARTCQIQQEAVIQDQSIQTEQQVPRVAHVQKSQIQQQRTQRRKVSALPIPDQVKHRLVQGRLTQQFMRQSNIVKPTSDDIRIARERVATELKRVDLDHQRDIERRLRKHH
jgi:hypothetical protein